MENKNEKIEYLPIGSIVNIKGTVKKIFIISRGLVVAVDGEPKFFDYGASTYPEGLIGDQIMYFNHKDIVKVVFEGFSDEDNEMMVDNINDWVQTNDFERGDPNEINKKKNK